MTMNDLVLLVLNKLNHSLGVYSVPQGRRLLELETLPFPHELCLSPDRRRLYVSEYGSATAETPGLGGCSVGVFDLAAACRIGSLSIAPHDRPHGIVAHPTGLVLVTSETHGRLFVFDTKRTGVLAIKTRNAIVTGGLLPHCLALSPNGRIAAVAHLGSQNVAFVDPEHARVLAILKVGARPEGMVFSPEGLWLYVVNRESGCLSVIDVPGRREVDRIPTGFGPVRVAMTPDGSTLVVPLYFADTVQIIETRTRAVVATIPVGQRPIGTTLSPDGQHAFVACELERRVHVISLRTRKVVLTVPTGDGPEAMVCLTRAEVESMHTSWLCSSESRPIIARAV
jgi:YVTN family beta-propeller protein